MSRSRCFVATSADEGMRLDILLGQKACYVSRSAAQKAIEAGRVLVSGKPVSKKHIVLAGQSIVYEVDEELVETPLMGEPIDLDIRFEDDDLMVISKQAGLVCHPTDDYPDGTLVNALIYHCGANNLCNVQGDKDRLGIVHRLDMDTSGLMLAAKSDLAGELLMKAIAEHVIDRRYLALVHGIISIDSGMIDAPIARHPKERLRMSVRECDSARDALTTFKVLKRFPACSKDNGYTLVECRLYTGRTHQIRVHMEYIQHPLVGDPLYVSHAPKAHNVNLGLKRQFLHSYALTFEHPITGEELHFDDSLADDLQLVLNGLEFRLEQIDA